MGTQLREIEETLLRGDSVEWNREDSVERKLG